MSASTSHKGSEEEAKDADLVHRTAAASDEHKPADGRDGHSADHDNGSAGNQHPLTSTSSPPAAAIPQDSSNEAQGDLQDDALQPASKQEQLHTPQQEQPIEDQVGPEDENIMQGHPATQEQAQYETEVKEQDRWLPIANVARIMKTALPDNAKIAKEAKECMQECVSEFISFITSEASEKCQHEKRKTVNGEDIIFAMTSLGFENYSEALRIYLVRYRESNMGKVDSAQAQGRPSSPSGGPGHTPSGDEHEDAPASAISQPIVPGTAPGVPLTSTFPGTQEADATNTGGAPYYPGITNGGSGHY